MSASTILEVKNISKRYKHIMALNKVTLSASAGTILGLVGPNGAGKTTLIKILAGIIRPDEGTVIIDGVNVTTDYSKIQDEIGYLPEKIFVYPTLTGYEFLRFMAGLYDIPDEFFEDRYELYLDLFKIGEYVDEPLGTMSKGMLQRIVLTSIFIREPKIYLLDEPFYGLDPEGIWILKKILREKARDEALVLVSSHILPLVEEFCNKIVILHRGKKYAEGTPQEVRSRLGAMTSLEDAFIKITGNTGDTF
ncbi:MAG: ABC transporter ATP-binding protein [Candidatus Asgardarchaeia archaeon]